MKKIIAVIVLVIMMTISACAEEMSFEQFCELTEVGDVIEQADGTYRMVVKTINGYQIVVTASNYEALEGDVTVIHPDGEEVDCGHWTMENGEENMMIIMIWIYNDYITESWA